MTGGGTVEFGGTTTFQGDGTILTGAGDLVIDGSGGTFLVGSTTFNFVGGNWTIPIGATLNFNGNLSLIAATDMLLRGGGVLLLNGNAMHTGAGNLIMGGDTATGAIDRDDSS